MANQRSSERVSEKVHRTQHELGRSILKAAEGGQNLPGGGGCTESMRAIATLDRELSPVSAIMGSEHLSTVP